MKFITEYLHGGKVYGSHIFAENFDHATVILRQRNINEVITGGADESPYKELSLIEKVHEACFLTYLGLKSGTLSIDETVGDSGVLHELCHRLRKGESSNDLDAALDHLRKRVPGYYNHPKF